MLVQLQPLSSRQPPALRLLRKTVVVVSSGSRRFFLTSIVSGDAASYAREPDELSVVSWFRELRKNLRSVFPPTIDRNTSRVCSMARYLHFGEQCAGKLPTQLN